MTEPVIISSGHTFEKAAIVEWFEDGNTINPLTGEQLQNIDVKPNYALKDAIKEYRRKLADELFRITFDEDENKEVLYYRNNVLFANEMSSSEEEIKDDHHINEYDGYITDDEQEEKFFESSNSELNNASNISSADDSNSNLYSKKRKKRKSIRRSSSYKNTSKRKKHGRDHGRNIPIIAFMGPNSTGKSTLLNLIVGEPVFVTIDELSDYDTLSKVVRFKIVTRADREFILLDVEGLFPDPDAKQYPDLNISDAVLKIFFAVYSIASVIVWNDTDENNPLLKSLLHRADAMMADINRDGESYFRPYGYHVHELFGETPGGSLLPEELRQFLMKKYKKLTKKQENKRGGINIGTSTTHKPAFIILRRDFKDALKSSMMENAFGNSPYLRPTNSSQIINNPSSPWLSSDNEQHKHIQINIPPNSAKLSSININYSPHNKPVHHRNVHSSPSLFSLSAPNNLSDSADPNNSSPSPRFTTLQKEKYQILSKSHSQSRSMANSAQYAAQVNNILNTSSGNDSATSTQTHQNNQSLSIVDELKEDTQTQDDDNNTDTNANIKHQQGVTGTVNNNSTPTHDLGINLSDSSVLMDNVMNNSIVFGNNGNDNGQNSRQFQYRHMKQKSNSLLFSEYLKKHDDFGWLRQLDLFSFVDGVCLQKLDDNDGDEDEMYQDDSLLSVLPKLDGWINEWCRQTSNVIPIVRNNRDMLSVVKCVNKYNVISSSKYVEDCMQIKGSRLKRYFYYDPKERGLNELKLIAERFKWDQKNLIRWFEKHFNRLWYAIKDFPNAHYALLYQALFYEYYLNGNTDDGSGVLTDGDNEEKKDSGNDGEETDIDSDQVNANKNKDPIIPTIILNMSHFYYQISNKVDLYQDIVDKSAGWGQFAGAVSGLGSLSLMSVIHPLVGIAAVPLSIHFGQQLGANSGAKVGDAIAYSKAHYVDHTERYDLGQIDCDDEKDNGDNDVVYKPCYDSADALDGDKDKDNDDNQDKDNGNNKEGDNDSKTN
eukprot:CAMPEP_0201579586 /NCGR_PEP_ID=MMETSP0190_2-20130828/27284_1 /ASSEMBLY_ACC=CAM_ASM_000263 /TAXON_ID=37353 /ORGANISM="Rosalina sp." /LENGTH=997 /DNA_ID=CAMNT_0048014263 /DNA_START=358 /DNA_END=3351 /DNA_ORIENTATION=+